MLLFSSRKESVVFHFKPQQSISHGRQIGRDHVFCSLIYCTRGTVPLFSSRKESVVFHIKLQWSVSQGWPVGR